MSVTPRPRRTVLPQIDRGRSVWHALDRGAMNYREMARRLLLAMLGKTTASETDRAAIFLAVGRMDGLELDTGLRQLALTAKSGSAPRTMRQALDAGDTPLERMQVWRAALALSRPEARRYGPVELVRYVITCAEDEPGQAQRYVSHEEASFAARIISSPGWLGMDDDEQAYALLLEAKRYREIHAQPALERAAQRTDAPELLARLPDGWQILARGGYLEAVPYDNARPVIRSCRGNDEAVFLEAVVKLVTTSHAAFDLHAIQHAMRIAQAGVPAEVVGEAERMQWIGEAFLRELGLLPKSHMIATEQRR